MFNDILDAITRRLDELFPGYPIYTDAVEQGLEMPCFFVTLLEPSEKPLLGRRYFRETGVSIQYVPDDSGNQSHQREINQVLDGLLNGMEYISLEDGHLMNGTNRNGKTVEGVLHFFVNYNSFILKNKGKEEPMDSMSADVALKGGEEGA